MERIKRIDYSTKLAEVKTQTPTILFISLSHIHQLDRESVVL